jgi:hypothetical protein
VDDAAGVRGGERHGHRGIIRGAGIGHRA